MSHLQKLIILKFKTGKKTAENNRGESKRTGGNNRI